ncbi:hypothetical protein EW145_g2343 [Phellinidium pouzarii]|uniref:Copper-fist domain-containing protein n=1 Tax=Phellinidium pouzarii TaxID=167371 RepID=A0A4S4LB89_9AGAM|nr:hypothetical protein EW145_g2343 [Phellinidium pouzarii]
MVFVNDKKYACETCIKGHRSSTCNHRDRPLFEIKKKGRPITQCEHCRELRKTKQVHVKCLCEGKDEFDAVSHSIPAKKANRKGPAPSAAFPHGLQESTSDSEEALPSPSQQNAAQRSESTPCACKVGADCECCTPRHPPRQKRSLTPPRLSIGDIRATASRPVSEADDTFELPIPHPFPHELLHGHGSRSTHGTALYNPYGLAHDTHMRSHDMRGHEASAPTSAGISTSPQSREYHYPVLPLQYEQPERQQQQKVDIRYERQQRPYRVRSEVSPTWPGNEVFTEDVNNMLASLNESLDRLSSSEPDLNSVDVDAWLRQMSASNSNRAIIDASASSAQTSNVNISYALPIPQALDISGSLSRQDQDISSAQGQYDLYSGLSSQFMGFDVDSSEQFLGDNRSRNGSDHDSDVGGVGSSTDLFDPELLSFTASASDASAPQELLHAPTPFPAFPGLTLSNFNTQLAIVDDDTNEDRRRCESAFDFLTAIADADAIVQSMPAVPALSRSSSTGSHVSSRSRSSFGGCTNGGGVVAAGSHSDVWHSTYDAGYRAATGSESWSLSPFATAAAIVERGRPWMRVADMHAFDNVHPLARTHPAATLPDSKDAFSLSFI